MLTRLKRISIRTLTAGATAVYLLMISNLAVAQAWVTDSVCPDDSHAEFHACATKAGQSFKPPLTADGQPNMRGIWRRRATAHESINAHPKTIDDQGGVSFVVDPPNGIVPIQPWAEAIRRQNRTAYVHHNAICRLSGVPVTMYMTGTFQFMQSEDNFLVQSEESHSFRVIPVDEREHIGEGISLWNGDSVGRWEGNTLIIDTTNQSALAWLDQRGRFFTNEAEVVERLTLVDADTIHYQATITDPNVYTEPFTLALAYRRSTSEDFEVWEEACYENNALAASQFKAVGYDVYPGMSGDEARRLRVAWELEEAELEDAK
jgi:hypothetical protein